MLIKLTNQRYLSSKSVNSLRSKTGIRVDLLAAWVLWNNKGVIKGGVETVNKLLEMNKKVCYMTNNSSGSRQHYVTKCRKLGYPAEENDVMCTSYMSAKYLNNRKFKGKVYLVGSPAMAEELDAAGIQHFGVGPDPTVGNATEWVNMHLDPDDELSAHCKATRATPVGSFTGGWFPMDASKLTHNPYVPARSEVRCVLVGFDPHISYMKMMRAATYLKRPDCIFLATNDDRTYPVKGVYTCIPDTGTMVMSVAYPSKREPHVLGKPLPHMFEELQSVHKIDRSRCVMVGDGLETDVGMARACGLTSLLVLSGVTSRDQLPAPLLEESTRTCGTSTDAPYTPDFFTQSVEDIVNFL